MTIIAVGVSHKTASVELRGKLSISAADLEGTLAHLHSLPALSEVAVVSTCNRTEVYAVALTAPDGVRAITEELCALPNMKPGDEDSLTQALFVKQGPAAVEHLFRVVSSLDSLVLGEAQIIGQVRRAYAAAEKVQSVGEVTNRLFRAALEVGKRVRAETDIGAHAVSVSTVAVRLAKQVFGALESRRVLVVGAGKMGELALSYLIEQGVCDVAVLNRTYKHAVDLAARVGGFAVPIENLETELARADIVIACAATKRCLLDRALVDRARRSARSKPLLIVDVALPHTVDPACSEIAGVTCCDLDGLGAIADENAQERARESVKAMAIVAAQTDVFLTWLQEREVMPTVKQMHGKAQVVCEAEVARALKTLSSLRGEALGEDEHIALEALANAVAKKLLHGPTARLRKQAQDPDAYRYTEAARYLFGLDACPQGFSCRSDEGRACRLAVGSSCTRHKGGACPHGRHEASKAVASSATFDTTEQQEAIVCGV